MLFESRPIVYAGRFDAFSIYSNLQFELHESLLRQVKGLMKIGTARHITDVGFAGDHDQIRPESSDCAMGIHIPRRIIQTGKSYPRGVKTRALVNTMRLLHPDYEYIFFDDVQVDEFITREFPQYRRVYDSFRFPIQKFDFFRYLAVYRYGGFYFDLDVLLASNLSGLLDYSCVFPFESITLSEYLRRQCGMGWEIGNYGFGASPTNPFLKAVIENCVRAQRDPKWAGQAFPKNIPFSKAKNTVLFTTGPGLVSRTLAENPELARSVKVLFPDDVSNPANWYSFGDLGVHLMESSWRPKGQFFRKKLMLGMEQRKRRALLKESASFPKMNKSQNQTIL